MMARGVRGEAMGRTVRPSTDTNRHQGDARSGIGDAGSLRRRDAPGGFNKAGHRPFNGLRWCRSPHSATSCSRGMGVPGGWQNRPVNTLPLSVRICSGTDLLGDLRSRQAITNHGHHG
jgi:hypothetical protein